MTARADAGRRLDVDHVAGGPGRRRRPARRAHPCGRRCRPGDEPGPLGERLHWLGAAPVRQDPRGHPAARGRPVRGCPSPRARMSSCDVAVLGQQLIDQVGDAVEGLVRCVVDVERERALQHDARVGRARAARTCRVTEVDADHDAAVARGSSSSVGRPAAATVERRTAVFALLQQVLLDQLRDQAGDGGPGEAGVAHQVCSGHRSVRSMTRSSAGRGWRRAARPGTRSRRMA